LEKRRVILDLVFWGSIVLFIVYFPIAVFMRPNKEALDRRRMARNKEIRCPWCQEFISVHALVCPHCRRDVRSTVSEAGYVGGMEPRAASDNPPLEQHSTVANQGAEERAKVMREIFPSIVQQTYGRDANEKSVAQSALNEGWRDKPHRSPLWRGSIEGRGAGCNFSLCGWARFAIFR
jgi:hypothetical protein